MYIIDHTHIYIRMYITDRVSLIHTNDNKYPCLGD